MPLETQNSKPDATGIRVLIVDDEQEIQIQHADLLTKWGYTTFVAQGKGKTLAASARELIKRNRCHVALVDKQLSKGGSGDWSGLELVHGLLPALSIIVSGSGQRKPAVAALKRYGAVGFVGKKDGPLALREAVEEVLRDHPIGVRPGVVIWPYGLSSLEMRDIVLRDKPEREEAPEDEADELICRLFPIAQRVALSLDLENQQNELQVSALRRRSRVFLAFVDGAAATRVVKIAPVSKIEREIHNYDKYVEPNLASLVRPEKYSQAVLWDFGAVAYSFLGNNSLDPSGKLPTFFEHYRANNQPDAILAPLHHFFDSCEAWYRLHFTPLDGSLFEAYDKAWDEALSREFTNWRKDDRRHTFASVGILGELPQPTRWLVDHAQEAYQIRGTFQALTHGDLHGDNLFVDAHYAWPIDFERTEPGPILRDFVELIQDILTRIAFRSDGGMSESTEMLLLYELAVALCDQIRPHAPMRATKTIEGYREADTAFKVVRELQHIAHERSGYTDQREFLWGLLLNNLFVLRLLPKSSPRYRRTLLLASVICARLERWGGTPWPTRDMQPVEWVLPGVAREPTVSGSNPSPPATPADAPTDKGPTPSASFAHGYALVVGAGGDLPVTVADAQAIREVLVNPQRCAYPEDHVVSLTGSQATRQTMLAELDLLSSCTQDDPESTVVVYFSGHGVRLDGSYLLTHGYNLADLPSTAVSGMELTQKLEALRAKRLLVLLDCCHAGGMAEVKDGLQRVKVPPELVAALEQSKGRVIISSSHDDQRSYIRPGAKHSLFTEHLIEALNGAVNEPGDTLVRVVSHLFKHVSDQVPRAAATMHVRQEPWIQASSGDFPVALLLGGKGLPALAPGSGARASHSAVQEERRYLTRQVFEVLNALTDGEIDRLCLVEFEDVGTDFPPGMSRGEKINRLVKYCQIKHLELDRLARVLGVSN
jgi:DNA-binding NarL/FixJ family response regulator